MQIKHRWTEAVLKEVEGETLRGSDLRGADLRGSDLRGADLCGADLFGSDLRGANLCGANMRGEKLKSTPVFIYGLTWFVTVTNEYLTIGCQRHSHAEWEEFSDDRIADMESRALEFWSQLKAPILSVCAVQAAAK